MTSVPRDWELVHQNGALGLCNTFGKQHRTHSPWAKITWRTYSGGSIKCPHGMEFLSDNACRINYHIKTEFTKWRTMSRKWIWYSCKFLSPLNVKIWKILNETLQNQVKGQDLSISQTTGSGKSLIFQAAPIVFNTVRPLSSVKSIQLVISQREKIALWNEIYSTYQECHPRSTRTLAQVKKHQKNLKYKFKQLKQRTRSTGETGIKLI